MSGLGRIVAAGAIVCVGLYGSTGVAAAVVVEPTVRAVPLAVLESEGRALHLQLDTPAAVPKSLTYQFLQGTAQPGSDFLAGGGTVTFAAGAVDAWTDSIITVDDRVQEGAEWIRVRFSSPSLVVPKMVRVTILDDDWFGYPSVSPSTDLVDGQLVRIQASGLSAGQTIYPFECERMSICDVRFPAAVVDRNGRLDTTIKIRRFFNDYGDKPYDCLFAGCSIQLYLDTAEDGKTIGRRVPITFRRVIPEPAISVQSLRIIEGSRSDNGTVTSSMTVQLDHPTDGPVNFRLSAIDVTAGGIGFDYYIPFGLVTIPAGATSITVPIYIVADTRAEPDEVFAVVFAYVGGAHVAPSGGAYMTIIDDD